MNIKIALANLIQVSQILILTITELEFLECLPYIHERIIFITIVINIHVRGLIFGDTVYTSYKSKKFVFGAQYWQSCKIMQDVRVCVHIITLRTCITNIQNKDLLKCIQHTAEKVHHAHDTSGEWHQSSF